MPIEFIVSQGEVPWSEKDKDATPEFVFNVTKMMSTGDKLAEVIWSVTGDDLTIIEQSFLGGDILVVFKGGTQRAWYSATATWKTDTNIVDTFTFRLFIREDAEAVAELGSALFPNRFSAIARMRRDRLMLLARSALPGLAISDAYLWEKLRAAEMEIARQLRVPLGPTRFFSIEPTTAQIEALNGMAWDIDPAYDYEPENFQGDRWSYILARNKPLIDVLSIRVAYPLASSIVLDVPQDWIRMDKRYGHINLVPSTPLALQAFSGSLLAMISGGRRLPFSMHIDYTAGLTNVERDWPDIIDVVLRLAAVKVIEDAYLPQSGSISADGLSQSMSTDVGKYLDSIDTVINGRPGSNGGLMARLHGIRVMVM